MKERLVGLFVSMLIFAPSVGWTQEVSQPQAEAVPSAPETVPEEGIEGIYASVGLNADGNQYQQVVAIVGNGDSFDVIWVNGKGEVNARGIGLLEGETLSVAFISGGALGLATYHLDRKENIWLGSWDVLGSNGVHSPEVISKVGPLTQEDREKLKKLSRPSKTSPPPGKPAVGSRGA